MWRNFVVKSSVEEKVAPGGEKEGPLVSTYFLKAKLSSGAFAAKSEVRRGLVHNGKTHLSRL